MSNLAPLVATCPGCGASKRARVFESLSGDNLPDEVERIHAGTFEDMACDNCGKVYRPEHTMLLAHVSARIWIVMHPPSDRPHFAAIERGVEEIIESHFAGLPSHVAALLEGVRPRLVFGQRMLTEAVRVARAGLDEVALECAKLLAVRDQLGPLMQLGPFELCFDRIDERGDLVHTVRALADGEALDTFVIQRALMDEAQGALGELAGRYPELFQRPYISACRYLYGATI